VKYYISIAGNIGAGKSALTALLGRELGWQPLYERFEENPYLRDFYKDMSRWGFHSQIFFLSQRTAQYNEILSSKENLIQDRSIYEDAEIFAKNLYLSGHINERDWHTYFGFYRSLKAMLPPPVLVVYLTASVPTLMRRIRDRGREFERGISQSYLESLNLLYEQWIAKYSLSPVLTIRTEEVDFVHEKAHLDVIVKTVRELLKSVIKE